MPEKALENKKIVMIIAFRDFRDEEYFIPKVILEGVGAKIQTASSQKGTAIGASGGEVEVDLLLGEIDPADFDCVVFIGGAGAPKHLDNEDSYRIARETIAQKKVLAAICIAPAILAKAGVLEGKKATVWTSTIDKSAARILEENGTEYISDPVVVEGNIVTGAGPFAASQFGEKIIEVLAPTPNQH